MQWGYMNACSILTLLSPRTAQFSHLMPGPAHCPQDKTDEVLEKNGWFHTGE